MNTTFTKTSGTINSSQCYEMTPSKEDLPPEPLKVTLTENNIDPVRFLEYVRDIVLLSTIESYILPCL